MQQRLHQYDSLIQWNCSCVRVIVRELNGAGYAFDCLMMPQRLSTEPIMNEPLNSYASAKFVALLKGIVGESGLVTGRDVCLRSADPFRSIPTQSPIIVRPVSTDEISQVMKVCHARRQRVVMHGGRTGVSGGAFTGRDEIVLSLERMNKVEEIDDVSHLAVVQAGTVLEALQNAVVERNLFFPVDLGSKGSATIGGMISTNAGGNRVLRWGMMRQNLLGIEAVLADGSIVSNMNRLVKNNTGYDLKHLFTGTEGTLGIVTRAVVRLVPAPITQSVIFVSVNSYDKVLELLNRARRLPTLSAFEVLWQDFYALLAESGSNRRPVEPDQPYYVLIETMGLNKATDEQMFEQFGESIYNDGLIVDAVTASSDKQVADLWRVREGSEVVIKAFGTFVSSDVSIDVQRVDAFLARTKDLLRQHYAEVRTASFGHLGDNNIHVAINVGADTVREEGNVERLLFQAVREFGGAITAEHGIGQLKRDFLPEHRSTEEMDVMKRVRRALDPLGILNHHVLFEMPPDEGRPT
jgi:FAD/FMN-containing dehydrogenase